MKLALSESQSMLKDTVARLFADEATPERLRAAEDTGVDQALWDKLVELGIVGIRAIEPQDGGMTLMDAAIVAEEAGRHVAPVPLIEAIVAIALLHRLDAPAALLSAVDSGAIATLALNPVVPGVAQPVLGGSRAHVVLALDGNDLVALTGLNAAKASNIAAAAVANLDLSDGAGERFVLATGDIAVSQFAAACEEWKVLTAAYLAGLGRRALELAAAYSVERHAYGSPIGAYQGIAHPMADAATHMDGAKLLAWRAIASIAAGDAKEARAPPWPIGGRPIA
ncbi:acyl-CoA/acyl-ACP dehydrogenase [Sphingomonas sp. J344]|uniref:acyl-CoA dehydrogenase family protein n=1 Tax=Sphingomonas sp. J344 TaxID=2898434 RepID=UPI0021509C24|nr:acyl-CoA dehydrogenase family protein [Sphingomonas sp. J344]MCR5870940.1 acyl-CoA/acyl-ACP dehydrogenase [Sphingomonas sp. J344]